MQAFLGIDPRRPAPAERTLTPIDYNRWRMEWVLYEEYRMAEDHERHLGSAELPVLSKAICRRRAVVTVRVRRGSQDQAVVEARRILVGARVVTKTAAGLLTVRELKALLKDLRGRLEARALLGIDQDENQRSDVGMVKP